MILAERQRATFLVRCEGERLRICHIHVSNPIREGRQLPVCPPGFPAGSGMALTERQSRVFYLLVRGEKYGDIAETLQIAPSTVRYYVTELCRKFHVKNRAQLVVAAERELLPEDGGVRQRRGLQTGFQAGFFVPFCGSGILTIPSYPSQVEACGNRPVYEK